MKLPENELQLRACAARAAIAVSTDIAEQTGHIIGQRDQTSIILGARQVLRMITGINGDDEFPEGAVRAEVERQEAVGD